MFASFVQYFFFLKERLAPCSKILFIKYEKDFSAKQDSSY